MAVLAPLQRKSEPQLASGRTSFRWFARPTIRARAEAPVISRMCATCEEETASSVQRAPETAWRQVVRNAEKSGSLMRGVSGNPSPTSAVNSVLRHEPGSSLEPTTRAFFETHFGRDFSDVRIHTSERADASAKALAATAYTFGSHLVFRRNAFAPDTDAGRRLLAHELVHVAQQSHARFASSAIYRAAENNPGAESASAAPAATECTECTSSFKDELKTIADQVASSQPADADPAMRTQIAQFADRLRAVAEGGSADEQERALSAFSTENLAEIDANVSSSASGVELAPPVQRSPDPSSVSSPSDPAELEADRVADLVVAGGSATVQSSPGATVQCQGEAAAAALGTLTTFEAAGGAEAEVAAGPPGWVVGGLVLLAIAGLTILTMARARVGTCSCQHRDVFTSGGRSCLDLRNLGICTGPYTGVGTDRASCQANARGSAPAACRGCLGHCLFTPA